jgi:hypothetical protein
MSEIGKLLIEGLEDLLQKLRSGEPIKGTQVERVETPDGPMHIRRKVMFNGRRTDGKTEGETPDVLQ